MSRRSRSERLVSPRLPNCLVSVFVSVVKVRPMVAFQSSKSLPLPRLPLAHHPRILEDGLLSRRSRALRPLPLQIPVQRHPLLQKHVLKLPWLIRDQRQRQPSSSRAQRRPWQNSPQRPSLTNHVPRHQAQIPREQWLPFNPAPHAQAFPVRFRGRRHDTNPLLNYRRYRLSPRNPLGRHHLSAVHTHHSLSAAFPPHSCARLSALPQRTLRRALADYRVVDSSRASFKRAIESGVTLREAHLPLQSMYSPLRRLPLAMS